MTASEATGLLALAMLEGVLVALPRAGALAPLRRLRSPVWAAVLPGAIVIGTFLPLWNPSLATVLVMAAAIATPALAIVALVGIARTPKALFMACALELLVVAAVSRATAEQLTTTLITALGAMSLGVALTRLVPGRWLLAGVILMSAVDVLLLTVGLGGRAAGSMATASAHFHGPEFTHAAAGSLTIDYPDLALAGALGGAVAGEPAQPRAAITLSLLAAAWGLLLAVFPLVPATPPIAATFVLLGTGHRLREWRRRAGTGQIPQPA
ncbi:hypothetical protein OM076_41640 [Solirubrobacter ginsenosidimutans]|uniref:Uncharacterized protein n=1 Tax=Solirubrobacter ginsenosidimutans TaxID=490573 RepID=A0A9X3N8L1_9ACTN|nr:hypothetical protein [Solirubrobacter ginsenosidimutans]MDA0166838.1 hypothetical protein [Solirubrobacter ginsenosidimutans]